MGKYRGSCHCQAVEFEVEVKFDSVCECNCSLCIRRGALWIPAKDKRFRIVKGEKALTLYRFGTGTAKHYFCKHCGIHPFSRPRIKPDRWAVNVRCLKDVDLTQLRRELFDGRNWEEAARDLSWD